MSHLKDPDPASSLSRKLAAWSERAAEARKQKQGDIEVACMRIASAYEALGESGGVESEVLITANGLRKRIEAAEQHRTMSAEHGLNNEAIDVTYEIQDLENQLIALIKAWDS